jgi:hypothetical protein
VGQLIPGYGPDRAISFMEGTAPHTPRGLLLYETFSSGEPDRNPEPRLQDSESLAVVIVALDAQASRASLLAKYGLDAVESREDVLVSVVPIDQGLDLRSDAGWADRTAEEILFAWTWLGPPAETSPARPTAFSTEQLLPLIADTCAPCRVSGVDPAERAHALSRGASASIVVVVSSSRKPPDWCCHSLA